LNCLCGTKHDIFLGARIPRRCLFIEAIEDEAIDDKETIVVELGKGSVVR
jgi:hypothetical protein